MNDELQAIGNAPLVIAENATSEILTSKEELDLIKAAIIRICQHIRPDGDFSYFDYGERKELLVIAEKLAKGGEEE